MVVYHVFSLLFCLGLLFQIKKSVIVTGEVKPMGFPILVQSRFEAKVKEVSVSEGAMVEKGDVLILLEKNIDESELYELEFSILSAAVKVSRLEAQLKERDEFIFASKLIKNFLSIDSKTIDAVYSEQKQVLASEIDFFINEIKLLVSQRKVKKSEISVLESNIAALKSDLILANKNFF